MACRIISYNAVLIQTTGHHNGLPSTSDPYRMLSLASRSLPLVKHQLEHQVTLTGRLGAGRRNHAAGLKRTAGSVLPRSVAGSERAANFKSCDPLESDHPWLTRQKSGHSKDWSAYRGCMPKLAELSQFGDARQTFKMRCPDRSSPFCPKFSPAPA
jgi:hypothetical protein